MIIRNHALERFWLERRLDLLSKLDDLAFNHYYDGDENNQPEEDWHVTILKKEYAEVLNPYDLEQKLKDIYSAETYGGSNKSKRTTRK